MRRGFIRFLLLATLGWVAFVAVNAWGTVPRAVMPVFATQLQDDCRFSFRVSSDMTPYIVRYEAVAQYRRARTSVQTPRCREAYRLGDEQVADMAARSFTRWLIDQRAQFEREHKARLNAWIYDYALRALGPPLLVWFVLLVVRAGFGRRGEA